MSAPSGWAQTTHLWHIGRALNDLHWAHAPLLCGGMPSLRRPFEKARTSSACRLDVILVLTTLSSWRLRPASVCTQLHPKNILSCEDYSPSPLAAFTPSGHPYNIEKCLRSHCETGNQCVTRDNNQQRQATCTHTDGKHAFISGCEANAAKTHAWKLKKQSLPEGVIRMLRASESETLTKKECLPEPSGSLTFCRTRLSMLCQLREAKLRLHTFTKHGGSCCSVLEIIYRFKEQRETRVRTISLLPDNTVLGPVKSRKSRTCAWKAGVDIMVTCTVQIPRHAWIFRGDVQFVRHRDVSDKNDRLPETDSTIAGVRSKTLAGA